MIELWELPIASHSLEQGSYFVVFSYLSILPLSLVFREKRICSPLPYDATSLTEG